MGARGGLTPPFKLPAGFLSLVGPLSLFFSDTPTPSLTSLLILITLSLFSQHFSLSIFTPQIIIIIIKTNQLHNLSPPTNSISFGQLDLASSYKALPIVLVPNRYHAYRTPQSRLPQGSLQPQRQSRRRHRRLRPHRHRHRSRARLCRNGR